MFRLRILHGIVKYLLLIVLSLSSNCLAAVKTVQFDDSLEAISKKSSRRLLYSWDDNDRGKKYLKSSSDGDNSTAIITVIVFVIVSAVIMLIRCCIRYGCEPGEDSYSDAVVHPPPRTFNPNRAVAPPPAGFTTSSLAPPRTSSTLIFPPDGEPFSINTTGIENPSYGITTIYERPSAPDSLMYGSTNETLTSLSDLPPTYDAVVREDIRDASETKPPSFPNVVWKKY